jgi:predicted protein tyrosine phosphatase
VAPVCPIRITVCGFAELAGHSDIGVTHVLSILDPGTPVPSELNSFPRHRRFELRFNDVIAPVPDTAPPTLEDVGRILALGRDLAAEQSIDPHLLIHCHAGFSRSPAALALLVAQARPSLSAEAIATEILCIRPKAWPNLRIVELGDSALDRCGQLVEAASTIYRKRLDREPALAELMLQNGRLREVEAGCRRAAPPRRDHGCLGSEGRSLSRCAGGQQPP